MLNMKYGMAFAITALVACTGDADPGQLGNAELGISTFQVEDTTTTTTVVGLDSEGKEVARVDLVHGPITLTGIYAEGYTDPNVDGRKLDVTIHGQHRLGWMTEGYTPTLHMPAHPAGEIELATFLADPHVKPVLAKWLIGFEAGTSGADELAYITGSQSGTGGVNCGPTCGTANNGKTINICGGTANAMSAGRITKSISGEYVVAQCCYPTATINYNWFALKTCNPTGPYSTCGSTTGSCSSCAGYPANANSSCSTTVTSTLLSWSYNP